jgi:3-oxoacyl-[acyl-carrier protein] reductase
MAGLRVLVTGGSGGIGQGICAVAAREGADVAFTWHGNKSGAEATEKLVRDAGRKCLAIQADLRNADEANKVVVAVEESWGAIDTLVNNAAFSEAVPFILIDDKDFADIMELNLFAAFRMCRATARGMIRQKYGRIVNISSITGSRSIAGPVHYAASKGALEGLTRSLAHEVGPYGVLVNAIAAGIFEGGLRSTIPEHHQKRYLDACALSRFGTPRECGEAVAWLGSRRNTYLNGTVIFLDGGTLA